MLLKLSNAALRFHEKILLDEASLVVQPREKIALLGRNGEGKSTLLKIFSGDIKLDQGNLEMRQGCRVATLAQAVPIADEYTTVFDIVMQPFEKIGAHLAEYHRLIQQADAEKIWDRLEKLQHEIEAAQGWQLQHKVEVMLSRLELQGHANFGALSGGWKRRVLLAQALVTQPDLLLLDEPTNHLDLQAIEWLEGIIKNFAQTVLYVSHDRRFIENTATRILELDRGKLLSFPGNYTQYQEQKAQYLENESTENALFDKKLAAEEVWIRQGIKARRTRNEGRVRALQQLRRERAQRRERVGSVDLAVNASQASGKRVIEAEDLSYHAAGNTWISHFNCFIARGDKIGILGPNGCGKTTLLRLLLGTLAPTAGNVQLGENLSIAYFDQLRQQLDITKNIQDNVAPGATAIDINGKRLHIVSYLKNFLFTPEQIRQPVRALSGGERSRVLLAKLFSQPANVLVLDEPTNDLDMDTLALLESLLVEFKGTVLLVCHDRVFLNNVATSLLVFEGDGHIQEYVGGYDDYARIIANRSINTQTTQKPSAQAPQKPEKKTNKPSYKIQRELGTLQKDIEHLEQEIAALSEKMSTADFYQQAEANISKAREQLTTWQTQLQAKYARWAELE